MHVPVPYRVAIAIFFLLREAIVLDMGVTVPVRLKGVLSANLLLERVSRLEPHELMQIKEYIEQHACKGEESGKG